MYINNYFLFRRKFLGNVLLNIKGSLFREDKPNVFEAVKSLLVLSPNSILL
jgi:hypothetical protein